MNLVLLTGNLARDPEKSMSNSGMSITRFTVAVRKAFKKKDSEGPDADFIQVTAFGSTADFVERYFHKGSSIVVEGRIQNSNYTDKEGKMVYRDQIIANNVEFGGRKSEGGESYSGGMDTASAPAPQAGGASALPPDFGFDDDDEDMPF